MRPTATIRRVHAPLIHFLGKRTTPAHPHAPAPHPQAPSDVASHFQDFLQKLSSYTAPAPAASPRASVSKSSGTVLDFLHAPARLTRTAVPVTDAEMDAILSGGASLS